MPVTVLYCEGHSQSIDIRLIRELLPKDCIVKPLGGKTSSFLKSIISDRAINPNLAGLVDHDFDCRDWMVKECPIDCIYENVKVGWAWERKEIENYLIDPVVMQEALGSKAIPIADYESALTRAADVISTYTAARTALSCSGFKNFWGESVKDDYFSKDFKYPKQAGKEACEVKIREIVEQFRGDRIISVDNVLEKFQQLRPSFRPGGSRFEQFLTYFAGKDLLCAMRTDLINFGFDFDNPIKQFLDRIMSKIQQKDGVWTWLPEWQRLRELIIHTRF